MTVKVLPNGNGWRVTKNGVTKSNHRKKSRAKSKARGLASSGEQLIIYRANGTIQSRSGG
ncbi:DUF2188 domain-containing protein [Natrinema sp. CGMCC1.2065]|uniref:DUF2188 domain-containing protein n=1 Tax=Natrinema sp. CGMCC1.2065 TaxID=3445767 RepID=UPI003F4A0235